MENGGVQGAVEIVNDLGLHTRAATLLVKRARLFQSDIEIVLGDMRANAKSILGLLALGARKGMEITVLARGEDQNEAFQAVKELVEKGFQEDIG